MRHPLLARSPAKSARTRKPHRLDTYGPGRSVPPLHVPCRRRGASASPSARSAAHARVGTRRCPSQCSRIIGAHTGAALGLTLVAVLAGARARHQREMASQDSHERPVRPAPTPRALAAWPTPLMPVRRTLRSLAPLRRQDGEVEGAPSDAMDVNITEEARPHAHPPLRRPASAPRRSLGCSAHTGARAAPCAHALGSLQSAASRPELGGAGT